MIHQLNDKLRRFIWRSGEPEAIRVVHGAGFHIWACDCGEWFLWEAE